MAELQENELKAIRELEQEKLRALQLQEEAQEKVSTQQNPTVLPTQIPREAFKSYSWIEIFQYYMSHDMRFPTCVCATSQASDHPVHMGSLVRAFASCLNIV